MANINEIIKTQTYIVDSITESIPAKVQNRMVYAKDTGLLYLYTGVAENNGWSVALSGIESTLSSKQNVNVDVAGLSATTVESSLAELATGVAKNADDISSLNNGLSDYVEKTTTVNDKALSGNITLGADDIKVSDAIGSIASADDSVETVLDAVNTALGTKLTAASNLSDLDDVATARTNLDVYSKSETGTQISTAITNVTSTSIPADPASASDSKIASEKAVAAAITGSIGSLVSALKYKGTKATYEELPSDGNTLGDVWNVEAAHGTTPAGTNYAWDGNQWDPLGGTVDLSAYQTSAITVGEESTTVTAAITANKTAIDNHVADTENPHGVTKAQVGLGNVDNTSDADKPISTAAQAALDDKANADASNIEANKAAWKTALGFIESGDLPEQVQVDWTATSGISLIANKPDVETVNSIVTVGGTDNKAVIAGEYVSQVSIAAATTVITIPSTATYIELKCVSGSNITKFDVSSSNTYKEIIEGNDVFRVTDLSTGSITVSASETGGKIQVSAI